MIRLETVEDFEKVAKALKDPKSKLFQYMVHSFGFCKLCNMVTEYNGVGSIEGAYVTCHLCKETFSSWGYVPAGYQKGDLYETELEKMSSEIAFEVSRANSRERQEEFFNKELEQFITRAKQRQRRANSEVRRLAKLRV